MSGKPWSWIALAAGAVTLAYWAGQRQASAPVAPSATAAAPAPLVRPVVIERTTAGAQLTQEALRLAIRDELARARHDDAPEAEDAEDDERAAAQTARRAEALTIARRVVDEGLHDGVWSASDRQALRAQLPELGERETHEVLTPLFQAINAQRLQLDGPPI